VKKVELMKQILTKQNHAQPACQNKKSVNRSPIRILNIKKCCF